MKRRAKIILASFGILAVVLALAGGTAHSQEPAWKRIQDRLKSGKTPPMSEAMDMANEASAAADANRARSEAAVKAMEEGRDPEAAAAGKTEGEGDRVGGDAAADDEESDPDLPDTAGIDFGSEADDEGVKNIFDDPKYRELMKDKFIYQSAGLPDPMIFPQVRNDAIFNELWNRHEAILAELGLKGVKNLANVSNVDPADHPKLEEALALIKRIHTLKDARYTPKADERKEELELLLGIGLPPPDQEDNGGKKGGVVPGKKPCKIPDNLVAAVKFVIVAPDEAGSYCLLGDYMLRVGDPVPEFPEIRVVKIEPGKVTLEATGTECETFRQEVIINPTEEAGFFGAGAYGERSLLGKGRKK